MAKMKILLVGTPATKIFVFVSAAIVILPLHQIHYAQQYVASVYHNAEQS